MGGALALARGYWASSTTKVRDRIGVAMDAIDQTLAQPENPASDATPARDASAVGAAD